MTPPAYAELDLSAVQHNLSVVRGYAANAKIMAVIKANAYGHGLLRIAGVLTDADAFAVARIEEGISLRQAGFDKKILVLEGFSCSEELEGILAYQLDAVVHDVAQINILSQRPEQNKLSVWLKVDTGMNRLGFNLKDFDQAHRSLENCAIVKPSINLVTHLANADDLEDDKTNLQISRFNQAVADYPGEHSIANSAGVMAWPEAISDWVRPGIMLYGISPFTDNTGRNQGLKPVMSLHSRLISVKTVKKGEAVGYGGQWLCSKDTLLGVVAIGYGDGYPRHAKAGTPVLVNGRKVPLIGRVSMDMITVDLSSQPQAKVGDAVTLWGNGLDVEEIASCAQTIAYTLVCGITRRVQIIDKYQDQ